MTPDNAVYFYSACVVVAVVLTGYIVSLAARERSLRARQRALEHSAASEEGQSGVT